MLYTKACYRCRELEKGIYLQGQVSKIPGDNVGSDTKTPRRSGKVMSGIRSGERRVGDRSWTPPHFIRDNPLHNRNRRDSSSSPRHPVHWFWDLPDYVGNQAVN